MSWNTWEIGVSDASRQELSDMIFALMSEVACELEVPALNEWCDAGIEIGDGTGDIEAVLVYYEMQETDLTDIDGTREPGYTLTLQLSDGQQETETFFADGDEERWRSCANYFSDYVVDYYSQFVPA